MSDKLITVFGGSGFVGRYIVQALLKSGARVRIAERNPKRAWFLKAQANLGQIQFIAADVTKPETVARAIEGADGVINLVGILQGDFDAVHIGGARNVAEAAATAGTGTLIQMSAIGADAQSRSAYGRSKGLGEAAVRAAFPTAVILQPSIIFGREDQFINRFAALIRMLPVVPVIGGATRFQPVFVGDVAQAVAAIIADPASHAGKNYALGGPQILSMEALNRWIADATGRRKMFVPVPDAIAGALATVTGWMPGAPITRDQWLMLQSDNVVAAGADGLATLGITPTPLDGVATLWLDQYKKHGRFGVKATAQ